jgi:hypothetical protein
MENPVGSNNFGRMATNRDANLELTEAEANLLRKLRTLQGGDYEAQYFDNKPNPNTKSMIEKIGNPTPLYKPSFYSQAILTSKVRLPLSV